MPQELMTLSEGTTVQGQNGDRFVIEKLLATGGLSSVYLVRDRRVRDQLYVLKEIRDPENYERQHLTFDGEILKGLEHPALPHVYQVFENTRLNRVYVLMDYVEGPDLEILRMRQPARCFSLSQTLAFMRPVVEAVGYLHQQQPPVVHRDIKPANIIVSMEKGEVKLVDFGLAKKYVEEKTTNVFRYGTPGYAAAEQYVQGTNPRTDIYALAATLYTLLSGVPPVDALTRNLGQHDEDPLLPLHMLDQAIPAPLSDVIEKAMSLRSKDRYATVEDFWQAVCIASRSPQTEPIVSDSLPLLVAAEISKSEIDQLVRPADEPQERRKVPRSYFARGHVYRPNTFLHYTFYALLACMIIGVALAGFLFSPPKPQEKTPTPAVSCMAEDLTPGAGNAPIDFPALAACYAGTVSILGISNGKTNLFLFHIQQSQEVISGNCNGFGTTGTFSGTVTKESTIRFTVTLRNQERPLLFDGSIGSAGELVLNYSDLDQNGHQINNEYGAGRLQAFTVSDLTPTVSADAHTNESMP